MELSNVIIVAVATLLGAALAAWSGAYINDPVNCPPLLRSQTMSGLLTLLGSFGPAVASIFLLTWWTAPIVWVLTLSLSHPMRMYIRKSQ